MSKLLQKNLTQENYNIIRDRLFDRIHKTGEEVKNDFPNILRWAISNHVWRHFQDAEGKPFRNLVEWMAYTWPNGTGLGQGKNAITYEEALKLTENHPDVHRVLAKNAPKDRRGGDRRSKKARGNQMVARPYGSRCGRNSAKPVLTARLAQEYPKYFAAYQRGEYRSIRATAEAAGLVKPGHNPLQRLKSYWRRASSKQQKEFLQWLETENGD